MISRFFKALNSAKEEFISSNKKFHARSLAYKQKQPKAKPKRFPYVDEFLLEGEEVIASISCKWLNKPRASNMPGPDLFYATQDRLLYWVNFQRLAELKFADIDIYSFKEASPTRQTNKDFTLYLSRTKIKHLFLEGPEAAMKEFFSHVEPLLAKSTNLNK